MSPNEMAVVQKGWSREELGWSRHPCSTSGTNPVQYFSDEPSWVGIHFFLGSDCWLHGQPLLVLAPDLVTCIPNRVIKSRSVAEALADRSWAPSLAGLLQYLQVSDFLENFDLSPVDGQLLRNKHEANGIFSSKSAYKAFFYGSITFKSWKRLWKSWALPKCKAFLWLALRNRCWTADILAKRGLPHPPACVLCNQEDESVQHILTNCIFARQFWFLLLAQYGLERVAPTALEVNFTEWWKSAVSRVEKSKRKGFNSLVILRAWTLWIHKNNCVQWRHSLY